jgi:hypothetical protein
VAPGQDAIPLATLEKVLKSAEARTRAAPRNLRRYVEDIFDQEVVGDAGF